MGKTPKERQQNYRMMIQEIFENDEKVLKKCPYRDPKGKIIIFLGDPVKVQIKYDELKQAYIKKRKQWNERFQRLSAPPQH